MVLKSSTFSKYFASEVAMLIFALLETDGVLRTEMLGITQHLYHSVPKAESWYHDITTQLNEAHFDEDDKSDALCEVERLFGNMVKSRGKKRINS